jgi:hypothetical protein
MRGYNFIFQLISTVLWLLIDLLSLKTDVNVSTVCNKQKTLKNLFLVGIFKATDEKSRIKIRNPVYGSKDPDPSKKVTDPEPCKGNPHVKNCSEP